MRYALNIIMSIDTQSKAFHRGLTAPQVARELNQREVQAMVGIAMATGDMAGLLFWQAVRGFQDAAERAQRPLISCGVEL